MSAAAKLRFVREEIVLPEGRTVGEALAAGRDPWIEEEVLVTETGHEYLSNCRRDLTIV